jgi:hypothetical protein
VSRTSKARPSLIRGRRSGLPDQIRDQRLYRKTLVHEMR